MQIFLLIMHINEGGVPVQWRKQDVPTLQYDDPGHVFCPARVLREFIGSQRRKVILVASCAPSEGQLRKFERVAKELECVLVLNTQDVVEYQEPKESLLTDFTRLAWELHRVAHENQAPLCFDDVHEAAQLICRGSFGRVIVIDSAGQRHSVGKALTAVATDSVMSTLRSSPEMMDDVTYMENVAPRETVAQQSTVTNVSRSLPSIASASLCDISPSAKSAVTSPTATSGGAPSRVSRPVSCGKSHCMQMCEKRFATLCLTFACWFAFVLCQ